MPGWRSARAAARPWPLRALIVPGRPPRPLPSGPRPRSPPRPCGHRPRRPAPRSAQRPRRQTAPCAHRPRGPAPPSAALPRRRGTLLPRALRQLRGPRLPEGPRRRASPDPPRTPSRAPFPRDLDGVCRCCCRRPAARSSGRRALRTTRPLPSGPAGPAPRLHVARTSRRPAARRAQVGPARLLRQPLLRAGSRAARAPAERQRPAPRSPRAGGLPTPTARPVCAGGTARSGPASSPADSAGRASRRLVSTSSTSASPVVPDRSWARLRLPRYRADPGRQEETPDAPLTTSASRRPGDARSAEGATRRTQDPAFSATDWSPHGHLRIGPDAQAGGPGEVLFGDVALGVVAEGAGESG